MPEDREFDSLSDEAKFSVLRKELWALRAEIVSLGGAECRLLREIDALKARLAETESKNGARTNAANAPGWLRMLVHR
ncbi:MAG TPA: hypothetical protein VEJ16_11570 [Alphaproteobacteria bacterium]|nr:hypothetical protein [Alphaproteobacteria bacterium]